MDNRLESKTPQPESKDGWFNDLWKSAIYSGVEAPVTGLVQIFDKNFNWAPNKPDAHPGTAGSYIEGIGGALGLMADFAVLSKAPGLQEASDKLADTGLADSLNLSSRTIKFSLTGFAYGGIFQPDNPGLGNRLEARLKNATISGATFGALGWLGDRAQSLSFLSNPTNALAGATKSIALNAAIGLPIGALNTNLRSLAFEHRTAGIAATEQGAANFAVIGGLLAAPEAIHGAMQNPGIQPAETSKPSYDDVVSQMHQKGLDEASLLAFKTRSNFINQGTFHEVYRMPDLPNYVLRVPRPFAQPVELRAENIVPVEDFAPDLNLGQAVAKVGNAEIVKAVPGEPYGTRRIDDIGSLTEEQLARYNAERASLAAGLPQEAYDDFAKLLVEAGHKGYEFDHIHPDNVLIDSENSQLHPIDFGFFAGAVHEHSLTDIVFPLMNLKDPGDWNVQRPAGATTPFEYDLSQGTPHPLQPAYSEILAKAITAAQRAGMSPYENARDFYRLSDFMQKAGVSSSEYQQILEKLGVSVESATNLALGRRAVNLGAR